MFESSFRVFVSSFRCFVVSLPCFVSSSLLQFRLVSRYRFVVSTFHCVTFLLRFVVPLAISSCRRPVSSFPCFDSSLLSSFRHFDVSFRRFVSSFRFAVLTALDWERAKVQFACPLHEAVIVVWPRMASLLRSEEFLKDLPPPEYRIHRQQRKRTV